MSITKHSNVSASLTVTVTNVILPSDQDLYWTFFELNIKFNHCQLNSLDLRFLKSDPHKTTLIPTIILTNSSFRSLDLQPETRAEIVDCYIDAQNESRPTLIKANNSDVKIEKSKFLRFVNENGDTILDAQKCSVSVENSVFSGHSSHRSVLYLENNSHMEISITTFNENRASSVGGAIQIQNHVNLTITNCTFVENYARCGGAIWGDQATLTINNSTFRRNKVPHHGRGIWTRGGAVCCRGGKVEIQNTDFLENSAPYGGAIGAEFTPLIVISSRFSKN